jgi:hypothetical protein
MAKSQSQTPTVEQPEIVLGDEHTVEQENYISFKQASDLLGVRFQQVFQRAVVRNKMPWRAGEKHKEVAESAVLEWKAMRDNRTAE